MKNLNFISDFTECQFQEVFTEEFNGDDESINIGSILSIYNNGNDSTKNIVNNIFISLCGWTFETLVLKTNERRFK